MLSLKYNPENYFEIGIDEAGRGPLFGRLYVAAVVLPEDSALFSNPDIKDSKKIKNKKKMNALSDYIKENARAWAIHSIEHDVIDKINIRQAVFQGMHACIKEIIDKLQINPIQTKTFLLVDGNDFKPYSIFDNEKETLFTIPHETIEGGDNKYIAIAAASILAKCARDNYIDELCIENPLLCERYNIHSNMGYGTKAHLEGILKYGITQWHRVSYARCKGSPYQPI
jgi:ribonuclease HII